MKLIVKTVIGVLIGLMTNEIIFCQAQGSDDDNCTVSLFKYYINNNNY